MLVFAHVHQSLLYGKLNFLISTDMDPHYLVLMNTVRGKILLLAMLWIRIRISGLGILITIRILTIFSLVRTCIRIT
jgi:hypothetical protein